jgi:DNA-binding response OmpR family regulator
MLHLQILALKKLFYYHLDMAKSILVVEDDIQFYTLYGTELQSRGYKVTNVSDGALAVQTIKDQKPDLVLLDLVLPGRNGLDILRDIRSQQELENLKVVILTNYGGEENVSTALELGATDYVMKYKIVPSELAEKIASLLGDNGDAVVKMTNM